MSESGGEGWAHLKQQTRHLDTLRERLQGWLRVQLRDPALIVGPLITPHGTGVANETLLFDVQRSTNRVEGYVARLATTDPLYLDADLHTHYRMYAEMMNVPQVPTPAVIGFEADDTTLGAPFFVMEKVEGQIPSDTPSWGAEGFIVDATIEQRRQFWENTVEIMASLHQTDAERFDFLRTGKSADGVGDCLDYWMRSLKWSELDRPIPCVEEAQAWLVDHRPAGTSLSWGDSRPPNVIYRDFTPVAVLDWDLVSLAGPQADLAWWIIMTPPESLELEGIGNHDELVDLWESLTAMKAADLHWFLVFGAYRLAAILAKLFATFVSEGRMPAEAAEQQLNAGLHVQLLSGLLDLRPPRHVTPVVPDVRWDR